MNADFKPRKMRKSALLPLFATALLLPEAARALCTVDSDYVTQNIVMDMGQVIISPDAQVGELLAAKDFPIARAEDISYCDGGGGVTYGEVLNVGSSTIEPKIFATGVQGVGIKLTRRRSSQKVNDAVVYPHTFTNSPDTTYSLAQGYFRVELYKTAAQTGSGPLPVGRYSTYYDDGSPNRPLLTSEVVGEGITVVSSSCKLDAGSRNIAVDFGRVPSARFTGVGVTHTPRDFSIGMTCNGPNIGEDVAALSFEYTPDTAAPAAAGVIRLQQAADTASGMGIQLLAMPGEAPVANGEVLELGTVSANEERRLTQDMRARYYQTQANVTSGLTRAQATFNIEYR